MNFVWKFLIKNSTPILLVFLLLVYALSLRGLLGNLHPQGVGLEKINPSAPPFESSLERGRYAQIVSLSEKHTFNVDEYADFVRPDVGWYNGHYYPAFPPGVAVLSIPLYLVGKSLGLSQVVSFSVSALFSLLTVVVMILVGKKMHLTRRSIILSAIVFSIGSVAFAYSVTLSAHLVSAFFITLCFLMSVSILQGKKESWRFLVLFFSYGINFFIDYPNLFILFPLLVITIFKAIDRSTISNMIRFKIPLSILYGGLIMIPLLFLFVSYNLYHYDKPITFTNRYNLKVLEIQGIEYEKLTNDLFSKKSYSSRFDLARVYNGINTLLISSDRGLFFFSPIFILALFGFIISYIKKEEWWEIIFITFMANLIIYAAFDDPWGGWAFGARYMIPTLSLMALMVGRFFDYIVKFGLPAKFGVSILALYGIAVSLLGALTTNGIPPGVEAAGVNMKDNFLYSWDYLLSGKSSSIVYNIFLANSLSPFNYFLIIFSLLALFTLLVIWIPIYKAERKI